MLTELGDVDRAGGGGVLTELGGVVNAGKCC